jgi:hypothetical protein
MIGYGTRPPGSSVPGGGGHGIRVCAKPFGPCRGQPVASDPAGRHAGCLHSMISPASWGWPNRPPQVPAARTAGLLAGLGVVLFGTSVLLVKAGATSWDARLFRILNQVRLPSPRHLRRCRIFSCRWASSPSSCLPPCTSWPETRSVLPVTAGAVAAGAAWVLAYVAKAIADHPRPYEVMADAVLRQQPAHGTSFPSSHTAVTVAVVIALVPFLAGQRTATTPQPMPGSLAPTPIPPPRTGAGRPECHRSHPPNRFSSSPASWRRPPRKRGDLLHTSSASAIINSAWPSTTHLVITMIKVNPTVWPTLAEVASPRVV